MYHHLSNLPYITMPLLTRMHLNFVAATDFCGACNIVLKKDLIKRVLSDAP
jgi:hypothetical protein